RNGTAFADYDIYAMTIRDPQALGSTVNRRINDDVAGALQGLPDIASSPSGTIFCVWEDSRAGNQDVFGTAMDSLGFRTTPNLRINDDAGFNEQRNPRIAAVGSDRYLIVWGDQRTGQSDIYGSYRNVNGAPLGPNFIISPDPVPIDRSLERTCASTTTRSGGIRRTSGGRLARTERTCSGRICAMRSVSIPTSSRPASRTTARRRASISASMRARPEDKGPRA